MGGLKRVTLQKPRLRGSRHTNPRYPTRGQRISTSRTSRGHFAGFADLERAGLSARRILASLIAPHHCIPRGDGGGRRHERAGEPRHQRPGFTARRREETLFTVGARPPTGAGDRSKPSAQAAERAAAAAAAGRRRSGGRATQTRHCSAAAFRGAPGCAQLSARNRNGTPLPAPILPSIGFEVPGVVRYCTTQPPIAAADPHPLVEVRDVESDGGGRPIKERRGLVVSFSRYVTSSPTENGGLIATSSDCFVVRMAASRSTPGSSPQLQVDETALAPKQRHARSLKGDRDRVWRERPAAVPPIKEIRPVKEVGPTNELRLLLHLSEASSGWSRSRRHAPAVNSVSSHRRTVNSVSSSRPRAAQDRLPTW